MSGGAPRLLLVGVGRFGRHHLDAWLALARDGRVKLAGLVVAQARSAPTLAAATGLPVHVGFDPALLDQVDAVDIATPTATHDDLVSRCLPHAHVFVEKPLCQTAERAAALHALARQHGHLLMTGHVYHHHPLTALLREHSLAFAAQPHTLALTFTNPYEARVDGLDPLLEWIHAFDLLGICAPGTVAALHAWREGSCVTTSVATRDGCRAVLRFGWEGFERVRRVQLASTDLHVTADYVDGSLVTQRRDLTDKLWVDAAAPALRLEMASFLDAIAGRCAVVPSADEVQASLALVDRARRSMAPARPGHGRARADRPRVAVLGGGVFGAACSIELAASCDVTLFERHPSLLSEASWINQWRHHSGFHYPRSIDTIREVQQSKADFESVFESVIVRDLDAYYAVAASAREINAARYIATCRANDLKFQEVPAPADLVYPERVSVCLHTDEAVVEIGRLSTQLMSSLQGHPHITQRMATEVRSGKLLADGRKQLELQGSEERVAPFDFLVNATYANRNRVCAWFGFPMRPLRFDMMEMSVLEIPGARRFMMTVIDGPFTSLTSVGSGDLFMLSGIHQSVLASQITADGLPPQGWQTLARNRHGLMLHGLRYLPVLKDARHIESRVGVRTVEAYTDDFDGRPTVVTSHGFGCWSILGGKIITVVTNARALAADIARQSAHLSG